MSMFKKAQEHDNLVVTLPVSSVSHPGEEEQTVIFYPEMPSKEEVVEMHAGHPEEKMELSFALPFIPGADELEVGPEEIEVSDSDESSKKSKKDENKLADATKDILLEISERLKNIPKHKGETLAVERTISVLTSILNKLRKGVQEDHEGKIDIAKAEDARIEIENGIERCEKELSRRKKKAEESKSSMTKEAQMLPKIGGIIVTVPILISRIARVCINGAISGGKDIEDLFHRQAEKYKLTDREKVEVVQLITDMGYPVPRLDRGFLIDDKEKYEYTGTNNYDYPANYQA